MKKKLEKSEKIIPQEEPLLQAAPPIEEEIQPSEQDIVAASQKSKAGESTTNQRISREEERECILAWQERRDESAFNRLLEAHDAFCKMRARSYTYKNPGMSFDDLHQEARMGFLKGIEKFDTSSHETRLLTYASWWILQNIERFVAVNKTIQTRPTNINPPERLILKMHKNLMREHHEKNGARGLSVEEQEEMESKLGCTLKQVNAIYTLYHGSGVSLDAPLKEGETKSATRADMLIDPKADTFQPAAQSSERAYLEKLLSYPGLKEAEREVIRQRYLDAPNGDTRTLEEVGEIRDTTRERVRQIEAKALAKLFSIAVKGFIEPDLMSAGKKKIEWDPLILNVVKDLSQAGFSTKRIAEVIGTTPIDVNRYVRHIRANAEPEDFDIAELCGFSSSDMRFFAQGRIEQINPQQALQLLSEESKASENPLVHITYAKALIRTQNPKAAAAHLEPHIRPGGLLNLDPSAHNTYAKALDKAGESLAAATHLEPHIGPGGFLEQNQGAHNIYAKALDNAAISAVNAAAKAHNIYYARALDDAAMSLAAAAHLKKHIGPGGLLEHNPVTHNIYAKALDHAGQSRVAAAHLEPHVRPGGFLEKNPASHSIYAKALDNAGESLAAAAHLESHIRPGGFLEHDRFAHTVYAKALDNAGESLAAAAHLEPHIRPGGGLEHNSFAHNIYAQALDNGGESVAAAAHLKLHMGPGGLLEHNPVTNYIYAKVLYNADEQETKEFAVDPRTLHELESYFLSSPEVASEGVSTETVSVPEEEAKPTEQDIIAASQKSGAEESATNQRISREEEFACIPADQIDRVFEIAAATQVAARENKIKLYNQNQERRYLTSDERNAFIDSANKAAPQVRSLCLLLAYTGCAITEALDLTANRVSFKDEAVYIQSIRKRGREIYRTVPIPPILLEALENAHEIHESHQRADRGKDVSLWQLSRTTAWRRVCEVMEAANIEGPQASPNGLRHAFGIKAVESGVPLDALQKILGHESIGRIVDYADAVRSPERNLVACMW